MPTKYPRTALVVNPVTANVELNLATAVKMFHEAAGNGSDLVLLGEMAVTGMLNNDDPVHDLSLSESIPGPITNQMSETARCFSDGSRDQNRWAKDEIPEYAKQVNLH